MDSYEQRIADFLAADKVAMNRIRWRSRSHPDYSVAYIALRWAGPRRPRVRVVLTSHIYFVPGKHTFTMFFGTERVLALDVDPRRSHKSIFTKKSFNCTHWHAFGRDEELDDRSLTHKEWLDEFWARARISYELPYEAPIRDKLQLKLRLR
jgi:hypothetical protein